MIRDSNLNFLNVLCHYPLGKLLRNNNLLSDKERSYAFHPNTHLDFIIYNKLSKLIVLAVEVDGHTYHKKGTVQHERDIKKDRSLKKYNIP